MLDWRLGEKWFMENLIDGDLASKQVSHVPPTDSRADDKPRLNYIVTSVGSGVLQRVPTLVPTSESLLP